MIDKNKTYKTRDGREVRIYATDGNYPYVIHGAIKDKNGEWQPSQWLNQGGAAIVMSSCNDLIEVKPRIKRTVWLNVYERTIEVYQDKQSADNFPAIGFADCFPRKRLACVKVEIDCEEGEGL